MRTHDAVFVIQL